ncbi:DUF1345 domain-containing protein [Brevundimonas nasdae]|uniref:DUF1345 domain-containing protein n=1 Tax=Brevundimonas nasdae TaxID=172043 RepID=A0ACD4VN22_9CAUL|nr:DUF1345 domain-containing protein [Brevundimonas nasdae]WOB79352.1 DUF1345 domain-containing protein [Brevundimonas nasdae]
MRNLAGMGSVARLFRLHLSLWLGLLVLAAVAALAPASVGWPMRLAAGWDAGVATFLVATFARIFRARSQEAMRRRAAELDQAGVMVLPLSMAAAVASVVVLVLAMVASDGKPTVGQAVFSVCTVGLSWLYVHIIFALHYAHGFYAPRDDGKGDQGGLIFPGEDDADYWDFLHFALIIGVANQTADVQISSRKLRGLATFHSLIAWFFNAVILALTVNLAATLL